MKRILLALLLLTGCASGPAYSGHIDNGTKIVIYRPSSIYGTFAWYWIEINGHEVCKLSNGAFVVTDVQPGQINIASSHFGYVGTSRMSVNIKKGETVYVKMEINAQRAHAGALGGLIGQLIDEGASSDSGPVYLGEVNKDIAVNELQGLNQDCQ